MEYYDVLLPLAIILVLSKVFTKCCERVKLPQVVGMLLTGVVLFGIRMIPGQAVISGDALEGIAYLAKIGVILIMFSAGIGTDIKKIRSVGVPSVIITCAGVLVPMGLGVLVSYLFSGSHDIYSALFYGAILTATSVSVTVATLREIGKLNSRVGNTIVAAAILDDIIGIVVLSVVISLSGNETGATSESPLFVLLKILLFFAAAVVVGLLVKKGMECLDRRFPHHRMIPIFSLAVCFFFAYASEKWFGVADITGAYVAGLVLSGNQDHAYIEKRSDMMSYLIFTPVFFANVVLSIDPSGFRLNPGFILFGVLFVLAGLAGKVLGCSGTALLCRYRPKDALRIGVGMMARAEVALVCMTKGIDSGLIDPSIAIFVVVLIVVSSFVTPIVLRSSYKGEEAVTDAPGA